jgi:hypothetical protein
MIIIYIILGWPLIGILITTIVAAISREIVQLEDLCISMLLGPLLLIAALTTYFFDGMENINWKKTIFDFRRKNERDLDP